MNLETVETRLGVAVLALNLLAGLMVGPWCASMVALWWTGYSEWLTQGVLQTCFLLFALPTLVGKHV
jgi:hypothetical protein